jgi:glycosyltransferase involved in cell wall biosynthesis
MTGMPKLSIIIATYNSSSVIGACLDSIAAQTFQDYEIILVDGASSDDTLRMVRSYAIPVLKLISEPDDGVYSAWNKGVKQAQGEWITFIGSDDTYADPTALQALMQFAEDHVNSPFVYGKLVTIDESGTAFHVSGSRWRKHNGFLQSHIYAQFPFPIMSAVYRRDFLREERFNEAYKIIGDMDLMLRCLRLWQGAPPVFLDHIIVKMCEGGVSTNPTFYFTSIVEAYRCRMTNCISVINLGLTKRTIKMFAIIGLVRVFGLRAVKILKKAIRTPKSLIHSKS